MNLDERIEALTMSLELLTRDHEDFKARSDKMLAEIHIDQQRISRAVKTIEDVLPVVAGAIVKLSDALDKLIVIAEQQELRIKNLENKQ